MQDFDFVVEDKPVELITVSDTLGTDAFDHTIFTKCQEIMLFLTDILRSLQVWKTCVPYRKKNLGIWSGIASKMDQQDKTNKDFYAPYKGASYLH